MRAAAADEKADAGGRHERGQHGCVDDACVVQAGAACRDPGDHDRDAEGQVGDDVDRGDQCRPLVGRGECAEGPKRTEERDAESESGDCCADQE